jgi:aminoglycoside phosphotransferase family enzyme
MIKLNQLQLIAELKDPSSFPHAVSYIRVVETHISWVFLTGNYAYKIKKPVKFGGILDFSKLYLRKKFCQEEVRLNRPLCGEMYLEVVKIVYIGNQLRIVSLSNPNKAVEYAVKMIEIPQKCRMDNLLSRGKISSHTIRLLAEILAKFHRNAKTDKRIARYGSITSIEGKIIENFVTLSKLTNSGKVYAHYLIHFLKNNKGLFRTRMKEGKIREIHGDLYLKNIFLFKNKFYLYDRIEFNMPLRYADVAEDIAHLSMDLDFHQREDLSKLLILKYMKLSGDINLMNIIYFLMCYKSCMRAKVSLFRANQSITKEGDQNKMVYQDCKKEALMQFALADKYMKMSKGKA